ncbi:hypothetical protein [Pseudoalteromonas sp. SWYJZ12]|uniref:hypothetical protein n=1 Tax=Pseudoalteromonas sp. SWYJZ12 TaxID=2792067 RepID=UPI0018CCD966|nr:hypothetical protein [Pseudoalteromonas sp. SWYJZ12]MBH0004202.1 hypothetical protein [Pseudoalteromonas sp. SWYJZ12]
MINAIIDLYTKADIKTISSKLLRSSRWQQHHFTAMGSLQAQPLWLDFLAQYGVSELISKTHSKGHELETLQLILQPKKLLKPVRLSFVIKHNNTFIKSVKCVVDTLLLANNEFTGEASNNTLVIPKLPKSDPIMVCDLDNQLHPTTFHATPSDICELPTQTAETLNNWWQIWQLNNLANFESVYAKNADVILAGSNETQSKDALLNCHLALSQTLSRCYAQLETVQFDSALNQATICWTLDGTFNAKNVRVRQQILTVITITDTLISSEVMQFDTLALNQQFAL